MVIHFEEILINPPLLYFVLLLIIAVNFNESYIIKEVTSIFLSSFHLNHNHLIYFSSYHILLIIVKV